jgi:hypothetical protein
MDRAKQIKRLKEISDEAIDFSDIPEACDTEGWQPNLFFKPVRKQISPQIDMDLVAWIKSHGNINQFLNKVLREKMVEERVHGTVPKKAA